MGNLLSFLSYSFRTQTWPPPPTFSVDQIPDLTGSVIIVTGGNCGIGFETAKALLSNNGTVYLACRNSSKAQDAIDTLESLTGKRANFLSLDLASFRSIEAAANDFLQRETKLNILFNNAGVMEPDIDALTAEGYDLTIGTNVLGHYYFTKQLLPALLSAANGGKAKARVVNTASFATEFPCNINFKAYTNGKERQRLGVTNLYYQSKFLNLVYSMELSRRFGDKGIVATCVNPGNLKTELQRTLTGLKRKLISGILHESPLGALTQLYAATAPDADTFNGNYFIPWARKSTPSAAAANPEIGRELWNWLEEAEAKNV